MIAVHFTLSHRGTDLNLQNKGQAPAPYTLSIGKKAFGSFLIHNTEKETVVGEKV